MSYIKVDKRTAGKFVLTSQTDEYGDMRRYYIARQETGKLMLIVCRNGLVLPNLGGQVVDAAGGWENMAMLGFVHKQDVGLSHRKLTIYRVARRRGRYMPLSRMFEQAPSREEDNDDD